MSSGSDVSWEVAAREKLRVSEQKRQSNDGRLHLFDLATQEAHHMRAGAPRV